MISDDDRRAGLIAREHLAKSATGDELRRLRCPFPWYYTGEPDPRVCTDCGAIHWPSCAALTGLGSRIGVRCSEELAS